MMKLVITEDKVCNPKIILKNTLIVLYNMYNVYGKKYEKRFFLDLKFWTKKNIKVHYTVF